MVLGRWLTALAFAVTFVTGAGFESRAYATNILEWSPPSGTDGWCVGFGGNYYCFSSPSEACLRQHQNAGSPGIFVGWRDTQNWSAKRCIWFAGPGTQLP